MGGCEVAISRDPASGATQESWFNIWAAGVDIVRKCVRNGMSGTVNGLGKFHNLARSIRSATAPRLGSFLIYIGISKMVWP